MYVGTPGFLKRRPDDAIHIEYVHLGKTTNASRPRECACGGTLRDARSGDAQVRTRTRTGAARRRS